MHLIEPGSGCDELFAGLIAAADRTDEPGRRSQGRCRHQHRVFRQTTLLLGNHPVAAPGHEPSSHDPIALSRAKAGLLAETGGNFAPQPVAVAAVTGRFPAAADDIAVPGRLIITGNRQPGRVAAADPAETALELNRAAGQNIGMVKNQIDRLIEQHRSPLAFGLNWPASLQASTADWLGQPSPPRRPVKLFDTSHYLWLFSLFCYFRYLMRVVWFSWQHVPL